MYYRLLFEGWGCGEQADARCSKYFFEIFSYASSVEGVLNNKKNT